MPNINILDKSIFNRIAAGEVVEKPASVVKELVENSIDAGATTITIEIIEGGIKKIKVTDNGCGMDKENLPKAFLPHATSKIKSADDLDKIGTLGFRGEALSSIASVAKVTVISKPKQEPVGYKMEIIDGEIESIVETGATNGTYVSVEDLFYCIPARAKFLRKPKQEETEITNLVSRLILANPNLNIKYIANNKLIFQSTGNGLYEAIYTIYGKSTVDNIVEYHYKNDVFTINGYIGKPTFSKPNRTYQTLIINGRYVINKQIASAIANAYENFMMHGTFPFYVIEMTLPLDKVDVNVHPNKLDVKFEDGNKIYGIFLHSISEMLFNMNHIKKIEESITENISVNPTNLNTLNQNSGYNFNMNQPDKRVSEVIVDNANTETNSQQIGIAHSNLTSFISDNSINYKVESDNGFSYDIAKIAVENNLFQQFSNANSEQMSFHENLNKNINIIGIAFNTYIIIQREESIYFIDQHAGHERILFDKFKKQLDDSAINSQALLVPYILNLNYMESEFIKDHCLDFQNLGFEIEPFGTNCFKINSVPLLLKDISLNQFFQNILKDIQHDTNLKKSSFIKDYLAKSACRSAVKANDILDQHEVEILINQLSQGAVLLCPHGRPIIIEITKKEIEKWFKRIV